MSNVVFVLLLSLPLLLFPGRAAAAAGRQVKLAYNVKAGDTAVYRMAMDGTTTIYVADQTQKTIISNEMFLTQKVVGIDPKTNIITYQTRIDSGKLTINGISSPMPMVGQLLETRMLKNGEIIQSSGSVQQNMNNLQLVFPDKPLRMGSTWSTDLPATPQVPVPLKMVYKVAAFEKYKERDCVKLESTITSGQENKIEGMSLELTASGVIYFDPARGQMVTNTVTSDMKMILKRIVNNRPTSIITRMQMKVRLDLQL